MTLPPAGRKSDVWERLRERLAPLPAAAAAADPADRAKRLADRARALRLRASPPGNVEGDVAGLVAFSEGARRYAIPAPEVLEALDLDHFSPLPAAPTPLRGVVPWRGSILCLLDLGRLFGLPETGIADFKFFLVVEAEGRRLAVLAGEVEGILRVPRSRIRALPASARSAAEGWVAGVHDESRLILRMGGIIAALTPAIRSSVPANAVPSDSAARDKEKPCA